MSTGKWALHGNPTYADFMKASADWDNENDYKAVPV